MVLEQPTGRTHISNGEIVVKSPNLRWSTIPKIVAKQIAFLSWHLMPKVLRIPPYTLNFFLLSLLTDNTSFKETGFKFNYTIKETIKSFNKSRIY